MIIFQMRQRWLPLNPKNSPLVGMGEPILKGMLESDGPPWSVTEELQLGLRRLWGWRQLGALNTSSDQKMGNTANLLKGA